MSSDTPNIDEIRRMADEVARLIADRFGGARRGERPSLDQMLRRRGAALPRRLRKPARALADADRLSAQPKVARQLDLAALSRARNVLVAYLGQLGQFGRLRNRTLNFAASVAFGLLVLGAGIVWILIRQGHL
ncbi:hypothetical protein [Paracoccus sp. (in: a-proteobacteria)]|uniref:hypothetical protein n=1 Tax=Paracoccus sp. TaxID=267 RepID=UPI003A855E17